VIKDSVFSERMISPAGWEFPELERKAGQPSGTTVVLKAKGAGRQIIRHHGEQNEKGTALQFQPTAKHHKANWGKSF
jgi:hypothetical protein